MSSAVLCCRRLLLLLLVCQLLMMSCDAARINRSAFMDGDVRSEVVDPNNRTIWGMFNLTEEQVNRIRSGSNPAAKDEATQANKNHLLDQIARQRINEIRSRIRIAVTKSDVNDSQAEQAVQNQPSHEKAGYPICNSETTPSNWQQSTNVTLEFASSVFQQYGNNNLILDSAILRLYKINPADKTAAAAAATTSSSNVEPTAEATPLCREPYLESQIRVTVYIVHQQKKKQRKKRTCNTIMLSSTKTGWVDIDVKCALTYWAQQQQQQQQPQSSQQQLHSHLPIEVGLLMIEVHDDEENQLLPGLYFQPPTCVQADIAVPWSVYGPATPMPNMENNTLSRCPRLDVRFLGTGLLTDKSFANRTNGKLENLKNQVLNPSRSREHFNAEVTTLNSPTIDNNLENSENENEGREKIHHHRRRHHHQNVECASMDADESFQQSETQHQLRAHHNHHHHHHHQNHNHHHHHHQHKHRHVVEDEE
ncbi:protein anachronism isoform X2 [Drosophila hydei]|uniref:Protein anachronism isoform X2 n=1 Tax=Drosophila hydei TaxID=7224 RepID=A0A6J1LWK4_DROHY|nr:protein anachronism isoform X2 [Drosophila hydei]